MDDIDQPFGLPARQPGEEQPVPFDDDEEPGPTAAPEPGSPLGDIRAELTAEESEDEGFFSLPVPKRPGYTVRFSTDFPFERWKEAQNKGRSKQPGQKAQIDPVKASAWVLQELCRGIFRHGEEVLLDGKPLVFASRSFIDLYGAKTVNQALRRFYMKDGHLMNAADRVLEEAGYGDVDFSDEDARPDPS